jgi:hypothetical protein
MQHAPDGPQLDALGAEHEAEAAAHKKLDQELESISTGALFSMCLST